MDKYDKAVVVFLLVYFAIVLSTFNFTTLAADEGTHSLVSLFYHDLVKHVVQTKSLDVMGFAMDYLVTYPKLTVYYPPFYQFLVSFGYYFAKSEIVGRTITALFSLVLIFFTYKVGEELFDKKIGLLSSMLLAFTPIVFKLSREILLDLPMFAIFMVSLYLGLLAIRKGKTKNFVLFGISVAFGFLTKWMIVLIAPVIFFFLVFSKMKREKKLDLFKKFLVSAVVFMAIVGPYIYLSFKLGLIGLLDRAFLAGTAEGEPQANSIEGWLYYSKMLPLQMSVPFVIASVLTFIYHVAKKEKNFAELGMWFLVVYIAFTLTNNKSVRYTILYLPALIYVFVYTISKFDKKVFFAILVLTLLSEAYFAFAWLPRFNYPVAEVMEYVLGNSEGNIAIVSERGDLFSSAFIFQAAKIDVDRNTQIFRPCIFLGKNSSEIEDYMIRRNIEKLILVEDAKGAENIEKIRDITLEREFGEVSVFDYEKFVKIDTVKCNYICTLEEEICV